MRTIILLVILLVSGWTHAQSHFARKGILDLRNHDFEENGSLALKGEWEFFMSELIAPDELLQSNIPKDYIMFPSTWNESSTAQKPGIGYATYHLTVLVRPRTYSLEIPHFYSNYALWINNSLIAKNGQVSDNAEQSIPEWRPQTVSFHVDQDTLHIVIQVSNFHHAKGGVREKILIGPSESLNFKRSIAITSNVVLCGVLILLSLTFFTIYLFIKHESPAVLFAALTLTWAIRAAFSNLYLVSYYLPEFPWNITIKIEYISLYLTMIWAILLIASMFKDDVNKVFKYLFVGCNTIFIIFTLIFEPVSFTHFLPVYLSFCGALLLFILYVLLHAIMRERSGVWLIVCSVMLGVVVFAYDLISYRGLAVFNPAIINLGYITMFLLMAVCLALQFGLLKRNLGNRDILRYEDLYGPDKK